MLNLFLGGLPTEPPAGEGQIRSASLFDFLKRICNSVAVAELVCSAAGSDSCSGSGSGSGFSVKVALYLFSNFYDAKQEPVLVWYLLFVQSRIVDYWKGRKRLSKELKKEFCLRFA